MVYVLLADGFEEIEAVAPIDLMRRAGIEVKTVGIGSRAVRGSHGIYLEADILSDSVELDGTLEGIVLPGGSRGAQNLDKSDFTGKAVRFAFENGAVVAAICAAPYVLGHIGVLKGKRATCYPGFENELTGAEYTAQSVSVDGKLITANGAGSAVEFGAALVSVLVSSDKSSEILKGIQYSE